MITSASEIVKNPKVSIIIPAYNSSKILVYCLESLMQLDFSQQEREIIVVDNNSTDKTKEIIRQFPVQYVFEAKKSRGAARNKGISSAKGKYIAFIDSDCIADKNWLKELVNGIEKADQAAAGGGKIVAYKTDNIFEKYAEDRKMIGQDIAIDSDLRQDIPRIVTANAIFQRAILEELGNFDEDLVSSEDTELGWRIVFSGYKMQYIPEEIVYHRHISNFKDFCLHQFEFGCASFLVDIKCKNVFNLNPRKFGFYLLKIRSLWHLLLLMAKSLEIQDKEKRLFSFLDCNVIISFILGKLYFSLKPLKLSDRLDSKRSSFKRKVSINYNGSGLKLSENIIWFINKDNLRLLNLKDRSYYEFNALATDIWLKLAGDRNLSEAIDEAAKDYDINPEIVKNDVLEFIQELKNEDILVESKNN